MLFVVAGVDAAGSGPVREAHFDAHIRYIRGLGDRLVVAGPFVDPAGQTVGSMIVIRAESEEDARRTISADPYMANGVYQSVLVKQWTWSLNRPDGLQD